MTFFKIFLKTKSDPNIHQNAPYCTIKNNFGGGGACPQTPLAKRMAEIFKSEKNIYLSPPPPTKS